MCTNAGKSALRRTYHSRFLDLLEWIIFVLAHCVFNENLKIHLTGVIRKKPMTKCEFMPIQCKQPWGVDTKVQIKAQQVGTEVLKRFYR